MFCDICNARITEVEAEVNPQNGRVEHLAQCGHLVPLDVARRLHTARPWPLPAVTGMNLIGAEQKRARIAEGFTAAHDARHTASDLAWAAWCLIDRAAAPTADVSPPRMWPWATDAWKPDRRPLRLLIIAGALIASEIDRRLARGETL